MIGHSMFFAEGDAGSQTRNRSKVAEKDTWRLEDLYDSEDLWRASKEKVVKELDNVLQYKGELTTSAPFDKTMAAMNRTMDEIEKILTKKRL
jgi:oligoendopeptidase F